MRARNCTCKAWKPFFTILRTHDATPPHLEFFCVWEAPVGCMVLCTSLRLGCSVYLSCGACWTNKHASNAPFRILMCIFLSDFSGFRVHFRSSWLHGAPLDALVDQSSTRSAKCRNLCENMLQNGRLWGSLRHPWDALGPH